MRALQQIGELHRQQFEHPGMAGRSGCRTRRARAPSPDSNRLICGSLRRTRKRSPTNWPWSPSNCASSNPAPRNGQQSKRILAGRRASEQQVPWRRWPRSSAARPQAAIHAQDEAVSAFEGLLNQLKNHHLAAENRPDDDLGAVGLDGLLPPGDCACCRRRWWPSSYPPIVATLVVRCQCCMSRYPTYLWNDLHLPTLAVVRERPVAADS